MTSDTIELLKAQQQVLEERERAAENRNRLLSTVARVANLLLRTSDYRTVLAEVVRLLGEAVKSDRCAIIHSTIESNSGKPYYQIVNEWDRDEIPDSQLVTPELYPGFLIEDDLLEIHQRFLRGEVINGT